jgi:hypothetical protein
VAHFASVICGVQQAARVPGLAFESRDFVREAQEKQAAGVGGAQAEEGRGRAGVRVGRVDGLVLLFQLLLVAVAVLVPGAREPVAQEADGEDRAVAGLAAAEGSRWCR